MSQKQDAEFQPFTECTREYRVGDAVDELPRNESAAVVHLDDAWARPRRGDQYGNDTMGVCYDTHPFEDDSLPTTTDIIDACWETLESGGWLIIDVDDWLLPRVSNYLINEYGDVNEPPAYQGGGYRKTGRVVYTTTDGDVSRGGTGKYLRQSGYPVVFAHKGETDRFGYESVVQCTSRQRDQYGWGTVKPLAPYRTWIDVLTDADDLIVEPCAGTAPACVAAEQLYGNEARYVAIDTERDAKKAFERRLQDTL